MFVALVAGTAAGLANPAGFANTYLSSMVLQRDAPVFLWGFVSNASSGSTLTLSLTDAAGHSRATAPATLHSVNGTWTATLPAQPACAAPSTIALVKDAAGGGEPAAATLRDVLFGDVLLVSGQSNVGISVKYSNQDNASAMDDNELEADRIGYSVRLMTVPQGSRSDAQQAQLPSFAKPCKLPSDQCGSMPWARANASNVVGYSALGWYLARQLYAMHNETVPVGVVQSDIPGTPIQYWSSNRSISRCYKPTTSATAGPASGSDSDGDPLQHSVLYNTMIHPLMQAQLSYVAVTWYQGESNVGATAAMEGAEYYGCALPELVRDWRASLPQMPPAPALGRSTAGTVGTASAVGGTGTGRAVEVPFFVVELSAYCNEHDQQTFRTFCDANTSALTAPDMHLPAMRIAQAAVLVEPDTYMESAMDLGSLHPLPYESIHPTNKAEIARRAALGLRRALLGDPYVVYRGPVPTSATEAATDPSTNRTGGHRRKHKNAMVDSRAVASIVTVQFSSQPGSGGLSLDASAACPAVVLDVYCRRTQLLGFEVQGQDGTWSPPVTVSLVTDGHGGGLQGGAAGAAMAAVALGVAQPGAQRVRYAYSDWPVVSLRNRVGGLPARAFDVAVVSGHFLNVRGDEAPGAR
jgi:hypothetical protein